MSWFAIQSGLEVSSWPSCSPTYQWYTTRNIGLTSVTFLLLGLTAGLPAAEAPWPSRGISSELPHRPSADPFTTFTCWSPPSSGYLGLIAFVLLLLRPLTVALRSGWRNRGDRRGDLLVGGTVDRVYSLFLRMDLHHLSRPYMFANTAELLAGLAQQRGY